MITSASLIDEAKRLDLPLDKKRAVLREYLQALILNAIYKHKLGRKMYFMGGTALRLFYKLPRFSEDLDFNAENLRSPEFDSLIDAIAGYLKNEGFKVNTKRKDINDVFSARLGFQSVMKDFGLVDKRGEDIVIKVEVNQPRWPMRYEALVLSNFGLLSTILVMDQASLLAEKSDAFIHRTRGRDVYDVLFLLRLKFPLDETMFRAKKTEGEPREALLNKFMGLEQNALERLANQVRPFLFKEEEAELVERASFYGPQLLRDY